MRTSGFRRISQWLETNLNLLCGIFILLFVFSGVFTLNNYGLTWDEGLGNLFFGERYLNYFTSFNNEFLNFKLDLDIHHRTSLNTFVSPFRIYPYEFPAVADTLSAGTMYLFSYFLNWLNQIDGFHLFTVLLSGIFLWVLYRFTVRKLGKLAAWMAIIFLATFPRFWADMHFNPKDIPEAIFFGFVIISYLNWYENPKKISALFTGLLFGCALGIKANAIFVPFILLASILPWTFRRHEWVLLAVHFRKYWLHYSITAASGFVVYIVSWPFLYSDVFHNLRQYWGYIIRRGAPGDSMTFSIDPLRQAIFTIPELMLLMFILGLGAAIVQSFRTQSPFWRILLLWFSIPILRTSLPGMVNFDGIRHFVEYVPAAAIIAGYGVVVFTHWVSKKLHISKSIILGILLLLLVLNLLYINLIFFPFLHIYYNEFVGGLDGARDRFLGKEASDYWASSYRQGMNWLNENAPYNSSLHALLANWIVELSGPVFLRSDINVIESGTLQDFKILEASANPIYLMFILRGDPDHEMAFCMKNKKPVYEIVVDHVTITQIYQFGGNTQE